MALSKSDPREHLPRIKPRSAFTNLFSDRDGDWNVWDICGLSDDKLLITAGNDDNKLVTSLDVMHTDSNDKLINLYSKTFKNLKPHDRCVAEIDTSHLVSCCGSEIIILEIQQDELKVTSCRTLKPGHVASCITANRSSGEIFVGSWNSNKIHVFNDNSRKLRIISFNPDKEKECPQDMASARHRLIVSTIECSSGLNQCGYLRVVCLDSMSGEIINTFHNPLFINSPDNERPESVSVNTNINMMCISWNGEFLSLHPVDNDDCHCISVIKTSVTVYGVSIDIANIWTEQDKIIHIFNMEDFYSFDNLKSILQCVLSKQDFQRLGKYLDISTDETSYLSLLHSLENKNVIGRYNVSILLDALKKLNIDSAFHLTKGYMNNMLATKSIQKELEETKLALQQSLKLSETLSKELDDVKIQYKDALKTLGQTREMHHKDEPSIPGCDSTRAIHVKEKQSLIEQDVDTLAISDMNQRSTNFGKFQFRLSRLLNKVAVRDLCTIYDVNNARKYTILESDNPALTFLDYCKETGMLTSINDHDLEEHLRIIEHNEAADLTRKYYHS